MKFLVDVPLSPSLAKWLDSQGHQAVHAFKAGLGTASDAEILSKAAQEGRIIITCDLDFPPLLAASGQKSPGLILFRGGNYSDLQVLGLLQNVLRSVAEHDLARSLIVVGHNGLRKIGLPLQFKPPA